MKPLVTAFGICALLLTAAIANADPDDFIWDAGAGTSLWRTAANWDIGGDYPGYDNAGDTATINANTASDTVALSSSLYDIDYVVVDADNADVSLVLQINSSGVLSVEDGSNTGYIRLIGDDDSGAYDAELEFNSGGSVDWDELQCYGDTDVSYGDAVVDINASLDVTSGGAEADVYAEGYVSIDVVQGSTLTVNDIVLGDKTSSDAEVQFSAAAGSGTGSVSCSTLTIEGGSSSATNVSVGSNTSVATR